MHGIGTHTRREPRNPESLDPHQHTGAAGVTHQENRHLHGDHRLYSHDVGRGRAKRLRLAGTVLASAIVMFLVLPGILFPLCHIVAGGKQEMIAVPLQQSALLLKKHGDELSQSDRDVFEGIPRARCRQQVLLACCRSDERHALDRATRTIVETVLACMAATG